MNNIFITDCLTITEISRLTKKSRPTIYKYISDYKLGNLDDIPFSFIKLFEMSKKCTKAQILQYCEATYRNTPPNCTDNSLQEVLDLIVKNQDKIDANRLKQFIYKELKK